MYKWFTHKCINLISCNVVSYVKFFIFHKFFNKVKKRFDSSSTVLKLKEYTIKIFYLNKFSEQIITLKHRVRHLI